MADPKFKRPTMTKLTPVQLKLLLNARERGYSDPTDRDDLRQFFNWRNEKQLLVANGMLEFTGAITAVGIEAIINGGYQENIKQTPVTINLDPVTMYKLEEIRHFLNTQFTSSAIRFAIQEAHRAYIGERSELYSGTPKQQYG